MTNLPFVLMQPHFHPASVLAVLTKSPEINGVPPVPAMDRERQCTLFRERLRDHRPRSRDTVDAGVSNVAGSARSPVLNAILNRLDDLDDEAVLHVAASWSRILILIWADERADDWSNLLVKIPF
jgi:hypothetical protein